MVTYAGMQFPEDEAHVCNILRASETHLYLMITWLWLVNGYNDLSALLLFSKALFSISLSTFCISLQGSSLTSLFSLSALFSVLLMKVHFYLHITFCREVESDQSDSELPKPHFTCGHKSSLATGMYRVNKLQ